MDTFNVVRLLVAVPLLLLFLSAQGYWLLRFWRFASRMKSPLLRQIVRGFGFGLVWDIVIGIIGAFIGVWLLTQLGFVPFSGFIGSIINAVIGAVILLVIVGFIKR